MNENNNSTKIIKSEKPLYDGLRLVMFNNYQREGKNDPDFSGWIENIDRNLINEGLKKIVTFVFWKNDIKHLKGIFKPADGYLTVSRWLPVALCDFKTVLNIEQALNGGNNTPSIKGTIVLMDGHTYNLALWYHEPTENKKSYYNGKLLIQKNNIFIVDQNII
jgi:hypothetical protein